jgi:hypothetical protein
MSDTTNIKRQFLNSLKRGTGEAFLIQKNNPNIDFSSSIIKGATTNFAYDNQAEGSRADYIYQFIKQSKHKEKIIKAVLKKLQFEKNDLHGLDQMCDLAVIFYKDGNVEAKTALCNRFEKNNFEEYEFCGQEQLMKIDGIHGVLKVAEVIGKTLFENPDDYEDSWRIDDFQKQNKTLDVYDELKKASQNNKFVNAYYDSILKNKWKKYRRKKIKQFTYELIKEKMESGRLIFLSSDRTNELTDNEVEKLANEFLAEKNNQKKELYLRFFSSRKFPFDNNTILKIASGKNPKNTRLVEYALESLKYFSSTEIRELALEKIKVVKNPSDYLNLLVSNYKSGDCKVLTEIANRSDNFDFIHSIVFGFIDIFKANPTTECKEPLELIYKKMNCGLHREDILEILIDNNVLSDEIFKEIQFDSYDKVRKLYRQNKNGR